MVPAASLDQLVAAAQSAYPHLKLQGVEVKENFVYNVSFLTPEKWYLEVNVDPASYRVRGSRIWEESLMGVLYRLHYQLLLGETGNWITGLSAILLFVLGITGVVVWPGWSRWKAGISLRLSAGNRILAYDLHKLTGILTALFLTILGFTGAYFMFNKPFRAAI